MEERIKDIREKISFSRNEKKEETDHIYLMKQESDEDISPMKTVAGWSNSQYEGKYIHWFRTPFKQTFTSSVPNFTAKGKGAAENVSSAIEAWSLLFCDDLLNIILKHTNKEIERRFKTNTKQSISTLDMLELKALIGLLYYTGWTNTVVPDLFSIHNSLLFRTTMKTNRFWFLLSHLRFDDKIIENNHYSDIKNHYFICLREIWNLFIKNCIQYYEPGSNVTINEYRFKVPVYEYKELSNKYKYGKIVIMNDSDTFYMINAIPYTVKINTEPIKSYYVMKISEPIHNTHRNITCSNSSFTSVPLVDTMHEKFSLTMTVSLRKDKPYIPSFFKTVQTKNLCLITYQYNKTLVSYKSENNEMVLLLSSLYLGDVINKAADEPEIILCYNKTKAASNKFVQLCNEYAISRKLNPSLRMFNHMLDYAVVNSFVLYTLNANNDEITRNEFLLELSMALIKPYLVKLLWSGNLHISNQFTPKTFLDERDLREEYRRNLRLGISKKFKKRRCYLCPKSQRISTRNNCLKCNNFMCTMHEASICQSCATIQFFNHLRN